MFWVHMFFIIGIYTHRYYDKSTWNRLELKILGIAIP